MKFKRSLSRLIAGALLAVSMVSPALAATGAVNAGNSYLRLRAQPNTSSSVLARLPSGTQVEVLDSQAVNGWYQVSYKGMKGYVSADYLVVEEDSAELSAPADASAPSAQAADAVYIKVVDGPLNIRTGPGTDHDRVGQLSVGRIVEALDVLDGWYQIGSGYVCADYVKEVDAAEARNAGKGQEIADYALQFLGSRYVYGGSSPSGFDCSGFTSYVYKQFGYSINRTASDQLKNGVAVSRGELQPGDLVMFKKGSTSKAATHVGLYIGSGQFIHASTATVGVIISSLSESYYSTGFVGARRIV